ncbi:hypothetical protein UFOVP165_18 [uncultured Caudovirales phage]|uniref:Scaffolding protein n=1 Tax=uncultured Caudovirales phage TaxID=2100421 RepID=A0A6J5TDG2_9CAUD|nr:hypothetical protein UFOVP72_5 [uncultured Caudovirales phage]CAB5187222.1 hypothetical protein UFOVP165_18 [uncultured Caudovirales phage]
MNDDNTTTPVDAPASMPESEATAAPIAEDTRPEEQTTETTKTFTQEELDAIVGKRLAREQRKWEREQAQKVPPAAPSELPPPDQFDSVETYAKAYAEKLLQERDAQKQRSEYVDAYHDREEDARAKYDDFEQVAYNPNLRITSVMAETIQTSDVGPDVAYYLGSNPKEADRISQMSPILQAKEIGKIEAKLVLSPPVKKSSNAPTPISPVTARSSGAPAYDTTDPRSIKTMTTSEWIAADRARQVKKLEASKFR